MRPARVCDEIPIVSGWSDLTNGLWLHQQIEATLATYWPQLFGYHLLKLGPLAHSLRTEACPIQHQFSVATEQGSVRSEMTALPFRRGCIDLCIAPFCIESQRDPHLMLREIDRVLIAGGHLLLIDFNLRSPLIFGYLLPHLRQRAPWNGRLFSRTRIEDWLSVLGYQVVAQEAITLHSFLMSPNRFQTWRTHTEHWLPSWGSVHLLLAKKLDSPLSPVKQQRQRVRSRLLTPIADLAG